MNEDPSDLMPWLVLFGPPIIFLFIVSLLSLIINRIREANRSSVPVIDGSNPEKERRRALGYDD